MPKSDAQKLFSVAEQGDAASREAKIKTARAHFEKGTREAAEAGLSGPEIETLALQAIRYA